MKLQLKSRIQSILLTKSGQFKVLVERKLRSPQRQMNLNLLKKNCKEFQRLLKICSSKCHRKTMKTKCKDTFSVVVADPGQKNLFQGLTLNIQDSKVNIVPFKLTNNQWRNISGDTDFIHSWNQAMAPSRCPSDACISTSPLLLSI